MKINKKGFVLAETLVVTVFVMLIFTIIYANFYPILGKYQEREYFDDIDSKYDTYWLKRFFQDPDTISETSWYVIKAHIAENGGYEFSCKTNADCILIKDDDTKKLLKGFFGTTNCQHVFITKYNLEKTDHVAGEESGIQFKGKTGSTYLKKFADKSKVDEYNRDHFPTCTTDDESCKNFILSTKIPGSEDSSDLYLNHYYVKGPVPASMKRYFDYLPAYKFPSTRGARYRIIAEYARVDDDSNASASAKKIHTFSTIELKRD